MGYKLFRALRWATDSTKPALNKLGALLHVTDTKRLWISLASGWFAADTPPIGTTYIRFAGKSDPGTLWPNTTWSNVSSDSALKGRALRIEGDYTTGRGAAAYGSTQDDLLQGHWHANYRYPGIQITTGPSWAVDVPTESATTAYGTQNHTRDAISDGVNGTPRTGNETRMANTTVQIWQRTA